MPRRPIEADKRPGASLPSEGSQRSRKGNTSTRTGRSPREPPNREQSKVHSSSRPVGSQASVVASQPFVLIPLKQDKGRRAGKHTSFVLNGHYGTDIAVRDNATITRPSRGVSQSVHRAASHHTSTSQRRLDS